MTEKPANIENLRAFFNLGKSETCLWKVLRDLKIRPIGGNVQWPVVWQALGLSQQDDPRHQADLIEPLMTAPDVGKFCGVTARTIYRWYKSQGLPAEIGLMPRAIDLSGGRENARKMRWRRSEIRAWQYRQPQPVYTRAIPTFGTLKPTK